MRNYIQNNANRKPVRSQSGALQSKKMFCWDSCILHCPWQIMLP